jgi:hypothetical protein
LQVPLLGPFPGPKSIVILDNCAIHRKADLEAAAAIKGAIIQFLPPYSPMYNPIEQVFGKVKQTMRSWRDTLMLTPAVEAILLAFGNVNASDCENWIQSVACYNT